MNFPVKIIKYLENKPKYFLIALGLLLVLILGLIDYLIPRDISVSIFYIIPICLTTWFAGEKGGIAISIASSLAWLIANKALDATASLSAIHYWNTSVRLGFFLTVTYLLSELRSAREREKTLARTDPTTGVANKKLFSELAILEIKRARRYGHPFTLAYIDVDDFKNINKYGSYEIGDRLLLTLAQTIKKTIRDTDILARIGGDEFALLLPGIGYETAHTVIARVQQQLVDQMDENKWPATFSIGAITFLNPPDSVDEIVEKADYLMYCIKNEGKNRIEHIIEQ